MLLAALLLGAAALAALWPAPPALAADPQEVVNEVSTEVMSPFCEGLTLHDCPSSQADRLRNRIERWARSGMTKEQIIDRLEREYGPEVRAAPPARGAGLLAWVLPTLAVGAGGLVAWMVARRWNAGRAGADAAGGNEAISEDDRRRLEAELAALREGR